MAKLFTPNDPAWADEELVEAPLHKVLDGDGDPIPGNVTNLVETMAAVNTLLAALAAGAKIELATEVTIAGTSLTAARMNNIEEGLDAVDTKQSLASSLTTTATAAGTTTLTATSNHVQQFTGTTTQTIVLPVTSTLELGDIFTVINSSTRILTINSSGANLIKSIQPSATCQFVCVLITGTTAASWKVVEYVIKATGSDITTGTDDNKYVTAKAIEDAGGLGGGEGGASTPPGRLTLKSGVPVSTTDQTDKTTLYYTPYVGNQIMLFDGVSMWITLSFAELSLNISAFTASKPYDIWVYNNAGTVTLDSTVWTNATTRATALAYQDGRLVKSGATTRLYLGTIYMDAASKCQDKTSKRFVWNYYNRKQRSLLATDSTSSWTYETNTLRPANNSTIDGVSRFSVIIGLSEDAIAVMNTSGGYSAQAGAFGEAQIGIDSTSVGSAQSALGGGQAGALDASWPLFAYYTGLLSAGYHYIQRLERAIAAGGTYTWAGGATKGMQSSILG